MSMNEIRAMREKRVKLWEAAKAFVESRKDANGTLSAEDSATYDQMEADVIRMGKEIERLERQEALDLEFDRPTARTLTDKPLAPEGKAEKTGRASDAYKAAFWRTMRDKSVPHEVLNALQVGTDSEGGYLVPDEYEHTLIESLEEENIFRRFAHIIRTSSGDRKIPIVVSKGTASWIDEEAAYPESDDAFGQTSISAYKLATMIKVSDELLHDSVFDVASYIAREFARRIGAAEEEAFFTGNGTGKPTGLLHTTGGAEVGVTTKSATALTFDEVMDLFYTEKRRAAAMEYAQLLADVVMPVWQQEDIQTAAADVDALTQKLREYSAATETEKPALLEDLNAISAAMDEGAMTEYIAMLTQIQSLLDSGMTEGEIEAMFPEIDFTTALEQIAAIQTFLNNREVELPGLTSMFGEALPEEVLKIATDLDMTGAQERWNTFAENPGAITTDVIVSGYQEDAAAQQLQPKVEAFIAKYTEVPEGADKAALTPEGLIGLVNAYAEITNGADVSGLTPENVTAMVSAYKELATGADVSTLKPAEITAYISKYMEDHGVDMSGLSPDSITAFVLAYQEVTGGALTTELTPDNITAMVTKYLEAENVDVSQLSSAQIEAIVSKFAEATGCDKSELLQNFTAYIAKYDDSNAVKPKLSVTVGIYGYDLIAYRKFIAENPVEVQGMWHISMALMFMLRIAAISASTRRLDVPSTANSSAAVSSAMIFPRMT